MDRLDPRTRRHLVEIAQSYETHAAKMERSERSRTWYLRAFVVTFVIAAIITTWQQWRLSDVAHRADRLATTIQVQRADGCRQANLEHFQAIREFRRQFPPKPGVTRAEQDRQIVKFVSILKPLRNCRNFQVVKPGR